jgi:uncharacterized protein (TIGR03083 family)
MLPVQDTRPFFRPLCTELVGVLRSLTSDDWLRPTVATAWRVRDLVAHLLDTALRRLSLHRDGAISKIEPATSADLVALINELNATWVRSAARLSPRVLTDLYARASMELADFMETLNLTDNAILPVSWAGPSWSEQWLDIGREFTEVWHHGAQIRDAVGAGPFSDARWLRAVLAIAMHALPHAYRGVRGRPGLAVVVDITGAASGTWTLLKQSDGAWDIETGRRCAGTMTATMTDETAWRLLFNGLQPSAAEARIHVDGDPALAWPLFAARAVIV